MKAYWLIYGLPSLSGLLAGCATLSQEEYRRGDWYGIGRRDVVEKFTDFLIVNQHHILCK